MKTKETYMKLLCKALIAASLLAFAVTTAQADTKGYCCADGVYFCSTLVTRSACTAAGGLFFGGDSAGCRNYCVTH